ncbi:hypothetical protein [Streptacidiphilus albus]|uniref:hypothetical protein n=1 Tax=Streptacidiphilus albus TaxID=105425 RepID=UPI00054BF25C|nr:hypothetical protein [Streptacidiphilus albus]
MARAISSAEVPPPAADRDVRTVRNVQSAPGAQGAEGAPQPGAGPLLRAIALQRPIDDLLELLTFLTEEEQSAHVQQLLMTAATLRPVGDVAALVPRLCAPQAATTLHAAAAYRPVEELAQLVRHLHNPPDPSAADQTESQQARWKLLR